MRIMVLPKSSNNFPTAQHIYTHIHINKIGQNCKRSSKPNKHLSDNLQFLVYVLETRNTKDI